MKISLTGWISRGILLTDFDELAGRRSRLPQGVGAQSEQRILTSLVCANLAEIGRFDEALEEVAAAQKLDPLSTITRVTSARILCVAGRYDNAIEQSRAPLLLSQASRLPSRSWPKL